MIDMNTLKLVLGVFIAGVVSVIVFQRWRQPKGDKIPRLAQEQLMDMARNSKLRHPEKSPIYYISCASNDKQRISPCSSLLKQEGIACVLSGELEPGANSQSASEDVLASADKCLIVISDAYLEEVQVVNSSISRDYRLIRNEFQSFPNTLKFVPLYLEGDSLDVPECLRDRQGISLAGPDDKWGQRIQYVCSFLINLIK